VFLVALGDVQLGHTTIVWHIFEVFSNKGGSYNNTDLAHEFLGRLLWDCWVL
jgi:hypothetical protein